MDVRTFWCKNFGFFEIYGVSGTVRTDKGWLSQCGYFSDKGGGDQFSQFYTDVFYGRIVQLLSLKYRKQQQNV